MAEYVPDSFKHCLFNPLAKNLVTQYPVLASLPCNEKVLKYILCLYDPKSPLIRDCRNIKTRKQEAARLAGFNLETDSDFLDDLYAFKNKEAFSATVTYLKEHIHNRIWTMIASHEQTFYEYNARLLRPVGDGILMADEDIKAGTKEEKDVMATLTMKSKLVADLKEIHSNLNEYYREMFEDDDLREKVVSNKITPESIARA